MIDDITALRNTVAATKRAGRHIPVIERGHVLGTIDPNELEVHDNGTMTLTTPVDWFDPSDLKGRDVEFRVDDDGRIVFFRVNTKKEN